MITTQRELKRAIYDTGKKIKDTELFLSEAYNEFLTQMQHGVTSCNRLGTATLLRGNSNAIAYTDGEDTYITYNSVLTNGKTKAERHRIYCGLNLHECGHLLFTDFNLGKQVLEKLQNGIIYPSPLPNPYLEEVKQFLQKGYGGSIVKLYHRLDNCIEDGFVDRAVMKLAPGYAGCLKYTNKVDRAIEFCTYEDMRAKGLPDNEIFMSMVLFYARHGLLAYSESTPFDEVIEAFEEVKKHIISAVFEPDPVCRRKKTFVVFCYLFHFVASQNEKQNGQSGQQGQNGSESKQSGSCQKSQNEGSSEGKSDDGSQEGNGQASEDKTSQKSQNEGSSGEKSDDSSQEGNGQASEDETSQESQNEGSSEGKSDDGSQKENGQTSEDGSEGKDETEDSEQKSDASEGSGNSQNESDSENTNDGTDGASQGQETQQDNTQSGNEKKPEEQSGQGESADADSQSAPNGNSKSMDLESLKKELTELGDKMPDSEKCEHTNSSKPTREDISELSNLMSDTQESSPSPQSEEEYPADDSTLDKIAEKVAESIVSQKQEKDIHSKMNCDVKSFLDGVDAHKNVHSNNSRQPVMESAKIRYEEWHGELDSIVRRLISEFEKEIKDRQTGDTLYGLYSGKRFSSREAYRYDKKVFNRKILPEDIPDMAVGIMVDLSGSMSGNRVQEAIKTVYITYTFCRKLNIPVFVVGHSTDGAQVKLISVVDENSLDDKDKYRIFGMDTYSCNRDGFALRYCLKKLENIQAEDRLMLVISDGKPNHNGYGEKEGKRDCQEAVADAIKKGIFTITAGIGDAESVKGIYKTDVAGRNLSDRSSATYLDLSDLKKLPKSFVKIIKERLS